MLDQFTLHDVKPGKVLEPTTADEAASILREATEKELRVECAGNGTQAFGNRRTRADIIISTRELDRVIEYDAADLVIGAQAGMRLHDLQRETRKNAQFFAQDPPAGNRSTIGGMIATGRSGPSRYAYGTPRDHVLGLEVVTGDGRVLHIGGRVVKNVAGYDLVRLFVGSAGTLGLITSAYLRLRPVPQMEETVEIRAAAAQPLIEITKFIVDLNLEATAIELVGPGIFGSEWSLFVRLSGNKEAVADARSKLATKSSLSAAVDAWTQIERAELEASTIVRLADLPSRIVETLQIAAPLREKGGGRIIAHAGDGIVRVLFDEFDVESTAFAIGEARRMMQINGGSAIVHSRNAELMRRVDAFGSVAATLPMMVKLKQAFDPGSVLAPGRFVI